MTDVPGHLRPDYRKNKPRKRKPLVPTYVAPPDPSPSWPESRGDAIKNTFWFMGKQATDWLGGGVDGTYDIGDTDIPEYDFNDPNVIPIGMGDDLPPDVGPPGDPQGATWDPDGGGLWYNKPRERFSEPWTISPIDMEKRKRIRQNPNFFTRNNPTFGDDQINVGLPGTGFDTPLNYHGPGSGSPNLSEEWGGPGNPQGATWSGGPYGRNPQHYGRPAWLQQRLSSPQQGQQVQQGTPMPAEAAASPRRAKKKTGLSGVRLKGRPQ